jgi:hypothetical protein
MIALTEMNVKTERKRTDHQGRMEESNQETNAAENKGSTK